MDWCKTALLGALVIGVLLAGFIYYYMKVYVPRDARLAVSLNSLQLNMTISEVDTLFPVTEFPRVQFSRPSGGTIIVVASNRLTISDEKALSSVIEKIHSTNDQPSLGQEVIISLDSAGLVDAYYWDDARKVRGGYPP